MKTKLFMDIHVLQTVPPSCINRDDTGTPKTAIYGGVQRARVSSACWKRAVREDFRETLADDKLSFRTRQMFDMAVKEVKALAPELDEDKVAEGVLGYLVALEFMKKKETAKKGDSEAEADDTDEVIVEVKGDTYAQKTLFFVSKLQMRAFAEKAVELMREGVQFGATDSEKKKAKKAFTEALGENVGVEIDLFGRMAANIPDLKVDACVQVADAISTHGVENEVNYFTAVDDLDDNGAGHIGENEFNSSTLYRYAGVTVHDLAKKLNDRASVAEVVKEFAHSFIKSMPTGKVNTHANNTIPDAIYISFRTDRALSLAPAFERAIPESEEGFIRPSAEALVEYANDIYGDILPEPEKGFVVRKLLEGLGENTQRVTLDTLLTEIENYIKSVE